MLGFVLLLGLQGVPAAVARAQDHYAARLTIAQDDVEVRRKDTSDWLPLPFGAETAFNVGDALRTGDHGRAYLEFGEDGQLLVLPRSTYELVEFAYGPGLQLSAKLTGNLIQKLTGAVGSYRLETPRLVVTETSVLLAVWDRTESPAALTVADGRATATVADETFAVKQGQGLLVEPPDAPTVSDMALPLTEPHLEGELHGCPGEIQTINNLNINIRTGISADVIGNAPDNSVVRVMATNRDMSWYRIQIFSGFGWIQAALVKSACTDLPVLPENSYEFNWGLQQIQPFEYSLLEPFYGTPDHDPWYYVSFLSPAAS